MPHLEVTVSARDSQPTFLHGLQMRSPGMEHHVGAGLSQTRADIATDRSRTRDDDSHEACCANASATTRRWIFPVVVRGIASTMWICLGRLKSESFSLQTPAVPARSSPGPHR